MWISCRRLTVMIRLVCIAFGKMKRASSAGTSACRSWP